MKVKTRVIYTVTRTESKKEELHEAKRDFEMMLDEIGEYLYGGVRDEKIEARLEMYDAPNKRWMEVKVQR